MNNKALVISGGSLRALILLGAIQALADKKRLVMNKMQIFWLSFMTRTIGKTKGQAYLIKDMEGNLWDDLNWTKENYEKLCIFIIEQIGSDDFCKENNYLKELIYSLEASIPCQEYYHSVILERKNRK